MIKICSNAVYRSIAHGKNTVVAKKLGLKVYGKSRFYELYNDYFFVTDSEVQEISNEVLQKSNTFKTGWR